MANRRRGGRSGVPAAISGILERLPGRMGPQAAGTARRLREIRFVGSVAELAFFAGAGTAPLGVAALALIGSLRPVIGEGTVQRVETILYQGAARMLGEAAEQQAQAGITRLLESGPLLLLVVAVGAVLLAARGFTGAMRALSHLYGVEEQRPLWKDALATVAFTAGAVLLAALSLLGVLLDPGGGTALSRAFTWTRLVLLPVGLLAWLVALYRYTHGGEVPWSGELPGGVLATVGIVLTGSGYLAYLRASPSLGLGSIIGPLVGGVVATFSTLFLLAVSIVVGGALNAERAGRAGVRA